MFYLHSVPRVSEDWSLITSFPGPREGAERTRFPLFAYVLNYPQGKGMNGILVLTYSSLWYLYLFITSLP